MTRLAVRPSIRARLALIYTGLLAAALIAFGAGVFLILRDELERSFDTGLLANAEHAAGAFAQDVDGDGVLRASERLLEQLASTGGRVVVLDPDGAALVDSAPPGTADLPLVPEDLGNADRHSPTVREVAVSGDTLRLTVEPIVSPAGRQVGYVAWADSTRPLRELLSTVSGALLTGGALVIGLALVGGLVLARRALAPVADVTETARAISLSGDFTARVEGDRRGDEVGELAVAFNEMLAALEENHQALQRFLGDASHQLRTPLTTIRANLDLAQRPDLPEGERLAILADARDEAARMARLTADLLSLARAESGARLEFAPVELDVLLLASVRGAREAAPHVRMSVSSVEPAVVDGDRDRLRELFGILLDNAARYTLVGGSVVAALEVRDGRAVVRVEDTGIGLDETDRERLFERLYRGVRAREIRPSGTGLGLAIAGWIVEAHAGTIGLSDRPGGGTIALVTLPVRAS
ncbi:MAG TPA: HAMP domain-containing sensor histidine kinase [Candidatus Sulfomarinibacteraceae bacterium]|nr:HAMP domain-containing sensor histidine kinase [Candidatus Sulfomarinibacteraceae bacterium]